MFQVSNKIKEGCERAFGRGDTSCSSMQRNPGKARDSPRQKGG